jgi:hypothetical protein
VFNAFFDTMFGLDDLSFLGLSSTKKGGRGEEEGAAAVGAAATGPTPLKGRRKTNAIHPTE